jgi:hypothetical protein
MKQHNGRSLPLIQIRETIALDGDGMDREALDLIKPGRDVAG